jgi:hypothetical protein
LRAEPVDGATSDTGDVSEAWPGHCTGYCALFWIREAETAPGMGGGWRTELSSQELGGRARQVGDRSRGKGRHAGFAARATRAG